MTTLTVAGALNELNASRFVVAGALAPALHSIRASRLVARPGLVEVHADPVRFRAVADPRGRSLHLGCGAALCNLRLSAAQVGYEPVVRLLPDRGHPTLLAQVRLVGPHRSRPSERLLYAASLRPLPARQPYGDQRPPAPVLQELAEAARLAGATLHCLPRSGGPQTAVITTPGDGPAAWLRAGQALQSLLLHGAVRAVSVSFLHEVSGVPGALDALAPGDTPQIVLQLARTGL
ncbi:hypothetical protein [Actinocorallia longicatena]|uniref:Uncharacterized protein n=1 Tax=Actinocorallia longicatena TaxID=111803 RepID=A0ABP6QNC6_9ACTN